MWYPDFSEEEDDLGDYEMGVNFSSLGETAQDAQPRTLQMLVATWNVGNKEPDG